MAARDNSIDCVEVILSHSHAPNGESVHVDVDALATEHQQTPLMMAALHGHVDIVRLLVSAGADINRQSSGCSTALIVACHYGHVDCVHALLGQCDHQQLLDTGKMAVSKNCTRKSQKDTK